MEIKLGQYVYGPRSIQISMSQQVLDVVIMTSSDVFEKQALQMAFYMKLGQYL